MAEQASAPTRTYRGNCHCKAHVYEITIPEIKSLGSCNCSSCTKKGLLWTYGKHKDLVWVKGDEDSLADYTFGKKGVHYKVRASKAMGRGETGRVCGISIETC